MSQTFGQGQFLPYPAYKIYHKLANIIKSSETWVFIDENERSINDAAFAVSMSGQAGYAVSSVSVVDVPSGRHGGSTGMSFADGHSIIHKWQSATTYTCNPGATISDAAGVNDMVWLSSVTSVRNN
jgi:prepilin-type processing-associated H-X9-DG protein